MVTVYNSAMLEKIYAFIIDKAGYINDMYGIDPKVFLIMSVVLIFPFYYSIYRLIRALSSRNKKQTHWELLEPVCLSCAAVPSEQVY